MTLIDPEFPEARNTIVIPRDRYGYRDGLADLVEDATAIVTELQEPPQILDPADLLDATMGLFELRTLLQQAQAPPGSPDGRAPLTQPFDQIEGAGRRLQNALARVTGYRGELAPLFEERGSTSIPDLLDGNLAPREFTLTASANAIVLDRDRIAAYLNEVAALLEERAVGTQGHVREIRSHSEFLSSLATGSVLSREDVTAYLEARSRALAACEVAAALPVAQRDVELDSADNGLTMDERQNLNQGIDAHVDEAIGHHATAVTRVKRSDVAQRVDFANEILKVIVGAALGLVVPGAGSAVQRLIGGLGRGDQSLSGLLSLVQNATPELVKQFADRFKSRAYGHIDSSLAGASADVWLEELHSAFRAGMNAMVTHVSDNIGSSESLSDAELLAFRASIEPVTEEDYQRTILRELEDWQLQAEDLREPHRSCSWVDLSRYGLRPRLAIIGQHFGNEGDLAPPTIVRWVDRQYEAAVIAEVEARREPNPARRLYEIRTRQPDEFASFQVPADQSYAR